MAGFTTKDIFNGQKGIGDNSPLVTRIFDVTFSSSYTASGEPVTPAAFGLSSILFVDCAHSTDGTIVIWDNTTGKLRLFVSGASGSKLTEAAGASNQSGVTARIAVWGTP